ncbi:MAG: Anaphase-promoting complex, cyclosome, subunit 3 [Bacteroidetes bacterium]|nr:Anaphase-promoting complex, cyclosome, subunit 3 [Bacteroidota bacterium]
MKRFLLIVAQLAFFLYYAHPAYADNAIDSLVTRSIERRNLSDIEKSVNLLTNTFNVVGIILTIVALVLAYYSIWGIPKRQKELMAKSSQLEAQQNALLKSLEEKQIALRTDLDNSLDHVLELNAQIVSVTHDASNTIKILHEMLERQIKDHLAGSLNGLSKLSTEFIEESMNPDDGYILSKAFHQINILDALGHDLPPQYHNIRGLEFYRNDELGKALIEFETACIKAKKQPAGYFYFDAIDNLAGTYYFLGYPGKALELCETILRERSISRDLISRTYAHVAVCHNNLKNPKKAEEAATMALSLNPENANAHRQLAVSYFQQGKYDEAMKCAENAMQYPKEEDIIKLRAVIHLLRNENNEAFELYLSRYNKSILDVMINSLKYRGKKKYNKNLAECALGQGFSLYREDKAKNKESIIAYFAKALYHYPYFKDLSVLKNARLILTGRNLDDIHGLWEDMGSMYKWIESSTVENISNK